MQTKTEDAPDGSEGRKVAEMREGTLDPVRVGGVSSRARFDKEGFSVKVLDGA